MNTAINYRKEIMNLTNDLPESKLRELINFAQFLKTKSERGLLKDVGDSAVFVRNLRVKETKQVRTGKQFIEELIAWQKSDS